MGRSEEPFGGSSVPESLSEPAFFGFDTGTLSDGEGRLDPEPPEGFSVVFLAGHVGGSVEGLEWRPPRPESEGVTIALSDLGWGEGSTVLRLVDLD